MKQRMLLNAAIQLNELFEKAVYVDSISPGKGKSGNTSFKNFHHFVAPIEMNNKPYRALITARAKEKSDVLYVINVEMIPTNTKGSSLYRNTVNTVYSKRTFDKINISDLVKGVKLYDYNNQQTNTYSVQNLKFSIKDSSGRTLTKEQQEYFKDSKVRDEDGNLLVMYHGTPNAGFTVFRTGAYFSEDKNYADKYQGQGASSLGYKKTADSPDTYAVYLNITKPFDTRNKKERDIFNNEYYGYIAVSHKFPGNIYRYSSCL